MITAMWKHGQTICSKLEEMKSVKDPVDFATAIWNHAPAMLEAMAKESQAWPRFNASEVRDLARYLREPPK